LAADPPFRTVTELAAVVACDRRTLAAYWARATNRGAAGGTAARLQDVLDARLLGVAAHRASARCEGWPDVAVALRVHERTLARAARRVLGLSLPQLRLSGCARAADYLTGALACCGWVGGPDGSPARPGPGADLRKW
jgi:hypothetical protein